MAVGCGRKLDGTGGNGSGRSLFVKPRILDGSPAMVQPLVVGSPIDQQTDQANQPSHTTEQSTDQLRWVQILVVAYEDINVTDRLFT